MAGSGAGPFALFQTAWHHRSLILRLARREIDARYRGSVLGIVWAVLNPILMLAVYTFVFSVVFQARWGATGGSNTEFALLLFSGLILFNVLGECLNRAPGLLLENISYIKKVVFPLEILPLVSLAVALFNAGIGFVILLVFHLLVAGLPPLTALLLPLILAPLCLTTLGLSWFFAAAGVFLRDLRQVVGVGVTVLMFLSPIFYPMTAIPERFRAILHLNPMTAILEQSKDLLFWGRIPSPVEWGLATLGAWVVAWLGYLWFMKTRRGFADVV
ncbi:sugar ABC transporter permease [Azospirillum sp. TSH100]|uniref:ABC transporter permease n=1 Tax=Azospirillum sp. TSH100 TaxID=652764 RepID=UPI000D60932B|nr:ABC transporter permease [Azospirillum sp. TSH100]PWC85427.1 sugar ABC transporter permease [Azospirillum sp. TSH100]QCG92081.1 ABC transporter permease [Azospirillum sp. TSH100]